MYNSIKKLLIGFSILYFCFCPCIFAAKVMTVSDDGALEYPDNSLFYQKNIATFKQNIRFFIDTAPSPKSDSLTADIYSHTNPFYYRNSDDNVVQTISSTGAAQLSFPDYYQYYELKWWSDCEIKGIDKWGNIILFTSTIKLNASSVKALHPEITDESPTIYYWRTVRNPNGDCWGVKQKLTNFDSFIGATIGANDAVTGIWVYPNYSSTNERAVPVYKGLGELDKENYPAKGLGNNSSAANTKAGYKWVVWGEYLKSVVSNNDNTIIAWRQTLNQGETFRGKKIWRPVRLEPYGEFTEVTQ